MGPVLAREQFPEDVDAVKVVVRAEEGVEHEQLADDVDDKEDFSDEVERDQIVALATTTHEAHGAGETVLYAHRKVRLFFALRLQIPRI